MDISNCFTRISFNSERRFETNNLHLSNIRPMKIEPFLVPQLVYNSISPLMDLQHLYNPMNQQMLMHISDIYGELII